MMKDISGENMSTSLLPQCSKHTWRKRVSSYLTNKISLGSNKTILLLLLWHFSMGRHMYQNSSEKKLRAIFGLLYKVDTYFIK